MDEPNLYYKSGSDFVCFLHCHAKIASTILKNFATKIDCTLETPKSLIFV